MQRYGWDLAVADYEPLWSAQLAQARSALLAAASLTAGERVLDVACGTGLVSFDAARAIGPQGQVLGIDLSGKMVDAARQRAVRSRLENVRFARMDAEALGVQAGTFDVALCALGLMYMPDPAQAVREMLRVLRPGGRLSLAVWGERLQCGWSALLPIVAAEVDSDVCPLFFSLGEQDSLARLCSAERFADVRLRRIAVSLDYSDEGEACDAAFVGGPVALAWSRFDPDARARVRARYVAAIEPFREGSAYRIPGEFVIVVGTAP